MLAIRYVHDLEEDAWSRPARKRRKTPRMGNTLKNGEAHYNSPVVQKRSFPKHPSTFCSRFWCRRVTKLRPDPKLPDSTVPMSKHFGEPDMYIFITVSIGFTKKSQIGPTRHLWYWTSFWCTYNGNKIYTLRWTYVVGGRGWSRF